MSKAGDVIQSSGMQMPWSNTFLMQGSSRPEQRQSLPITFILIFFVYPGLLILANLYGSSFGIQIIIVMGIPIIMAIRRRKVGNAVYLEEYNSHREKWKVVADFVRYIGREDNEKRVMESVRIIERVRPSGSTRSGDVDLLWAMAQDLEIPGIIDRITPARSSISPGKVLTAWTINRVIDPGSATQLES